MTAVGLSESLQERLLILNGDIEGFPNHHYRSTVWPLYRDRLKRCKLDYKGQCQSEDYYIHGPHGFSN